MSLNIVIPTYKRPERVLSKALVTNPILCVSESEKEAYREFNPECEIVTHPDSVKGLPAKRNWTEADQMIEGFKSDDTFKNVNYSTKKPSWNASRYTSTFRPAKSWTRFVK